MSRFRRETARAVRILFAPLLGVVALASAHAQTTITEWTFEGPPSSNTSPAPSSGAGTAALVSGTTAT
ncbi:MAG: hypothetical protein ACK4XK_01495, partial [Casimicrobiaceae bacterium]